MKQDLAGRSVAQWDPRLAGPCLVTVYSLADQPLRTDSVDAGMRLSLPGLAGQTLQRWDDRGAVWLMTYDRQLRPLSVNNSATPQDDELFEYADATADAGNNLRGQHQRLTDPSGCVEVHSYSLAGHSQRETRTFHDEKSFTSQRTYGPLGAVTALTDAGQHRQTMLYDLAGQLKATSLILKDGIERGVLIDAQYNAAGQLVTQQNGNGVSVHWDYDPANSLLVRQRAHKGSEPPIQDLEYTYDPMGMITRIFDAAVKPVFFANQRCDGTRTFTYDSLYQLSSATGCSAAALPQPVRAQSCDPADLRNYLQNYEYDYGGNLIKIIQVREGASHTRHILIDPHSNRGISQEADDPPPDFSRLFDPHGNLLERLPGQPLRWNSRDELQSVVMISRADGREDAEQCWYSEGVRVCKRYEHYGNNTSHFHQVRYLPGLEISSKDNGEELHAITVTTGAGTVRCLYWENDPANIGTTQLRYGLNDHLNSCLIELDQLGQMISHEQFFPFGATACFLSLTDIEVDYKTIRYSGKELDRSGLYYYGERYYAPWLGRWTQPDRHGIADGLNLYCMTHNNPINFVDQQGAMTTPSQSGSASQTSGASHTSIAISTPGSSRRSSSASVPALVTDPQANPPGRLPPEPELTWGERAKAAALSFANSRLGLTLVPEGGLSMTSAAIISPILTVAVRLVLDAILFNPGWSPANTWDPEGDGQLPPVDVTQDENRKYSMITSGVTGAVALAGILLGPMLGEYIDGWRGTVLRAANDQRGGVLMDAAEQRINDYQLVADPTEKALNALRAQVVEAEALAGVTWRSMGMLEKIDLMRPPPVAAVAAVTPTNSSGSSRRGSTSSGRSSSSSGSTQSSVRRRNNLAAKSSKPKRV
ncbi:RHS repeat-associated core domain-containing protein [Pseudomonas granadensis]|uniref:RHS repeat-associated core domain-containing protein n=1 Tax=Pseudomonas granadensis TaxID=1421430 RepID=A0ABX7GCX1_9PSED|nr:RHS repeat-associated core domain-containing protein [Pseudomonas granadensis]QRK83198.1 RHS repeat-associated core domain-containing protein [Pseudomonas granadensis]